MNAKELAELLERLERLATKPKYRHIEADAAMTDAAAAIRSLIVELQDGQELVALPWIVEYMRQDGGHGWKPMAAFDFETPAQNYANDCAKNNKTWEYRVVPAPIAPNAAQSDGEMVKDAERYRWAAPILDGSNDKVADMRALALAEQLAKGLTGDAAIDAAMLAASKKEENVSNRERHAAEVIEGMRRAAEICEDYEDDMGYGKPQGCADEIRVEISRLKGEGSDHE